MSLTSILLLACSDLALDPPVDHPHVVYDPATSTVPLPNDLVTSDGTLDLPLDTDGLSDVEIEVRERMNTMDGWPTVTPITFTLSHEVTTLAGVRVWEWGANPVELDLELTADGTEVELTPPEGGWERGGRYLVVVDSGLQTSAGSVGPDALFWYLRQTVDLDDPAHNSAFPGDTRDERAGTAADLEALRAELSPYLDHAEEQGIERASIAAAWTFQATSAVEVAMDPDSGRVPLPFDLLIDPATGLVELPVEDDQSELEQEARRVANTLDGFGLNANLMFDTTDEVLLDDDVDIALYEIDQTPVRHAVDVRLMEERHLVLEPRELPLKTSATYAVVVRDLRDVRRDPVVSMPLGLLVTANNPLVDDGEALVDLPLEDAERLEGVRQELDPLLDFLGRDDVIAAWPFTTLSPRPKQAEAISAAADLGLDPAVTIDSDKPAYSIIYDHALEDLFPGALNPAPAIYSGRVLGVDRIVQGTLQSPDFLDDDRRWTEDWEPNAIQYLAVIPDDPDPELPVIVFGHAIVTDRRFLMTIAGDLARKGFYAVAIDFPFHGPRTECVESSLVALPNVLPPELQVLTGLEDEILWLPPCESGDDATCSPTGECLDADGNVEDFSAFPIIDMYPASGAAFMDMSDLPHIPDHFLQALVDLGSLQNALETGALDEAFGAEIRKDRFHYAGQSMGSIIGLTYVAHTPEIERAVFNVPGADLVDLFRYSDYFGPQIDAWMHDNELEDGSYEQERLLNVAKWLVDSIDPHSVGELYAQDDREILLQIDRVDEDAGDLIIPNFTTERFQETTGLQMEAYPSVLHADLIVPVIGDQMLRDMATFLDEGEL